MYSILNIGSLPGALSTNPRGINAAGQVVGNCTMPGGAAGAFLWDQANGMIELPAPGGANCWASAINSDGLIVGEAVLPGIDPIAGCATIWKNESVLTVLMQTSGGNDINDSGLAACTINLPGGQYSYAAIFSASGVVPLGSPTPTGLPGSSSLANGINNLGQVVGMMQFAPPGLASEAALWSSPTQVQELGALPGGTTSLGSKITDAGAVIGISVGVGGERGFIWQAGSGMIDLNPGGPSFTAHGINPSGLIVGVFQGNASIISGGVIQNLNQMILPGTNPTLDVAYAINEAGQIVATGTASGQRGAFLLTPVLAPKRPNRPFTCEPLLQKFLMWNADLNQREKELANLGLPQGEIDKDSTVMTLTSNIARLSVEMTDVGCPPPLLVKLPPVADRH
jgi:probable HAF family extracellular repeat protein